MPGFVAILIFPLKVYYYDLFLERFSFLHHILDYAA